MKKKEIKKDLVEEKLLKGLSAYERMIAYKRKNNQQIVGRSEGKNLTIHPQKPQESAANWGTKFIIQNSTFIKSELDNRKRIRRYYV